MKIGIIVDDLQLARWQAGALATLPGHCEFVVYNCTNSRPSRRSLRHAGYYALNLLSLRTRMTAPVRLPGELRISTRTEFAADLDGAWQRLPKGVVEKIVTDRPAVLIKFGMGLLRVPSQSELPIPILSYHHGDPRVFRGRPAGFYELLTGSETIGQVVQLLSNRLDAGEIVAYGETKCHGHSYRRTMLEAYRGSPLLLKTAINNAATGKRVAIEPTGGVFRLPSNGLVLRFLARQLVSMARHWSCGAAIEKAWRVAEADAPAEDGPTPLSNLPERRTWRDIECPSQYRFLADPFYHPRGAGLLVEALNKSTNLGEILQLTAAGDKPIASEAGGHFSYPATVTTGGQHYLVPEVSEWSSAKIYRLSQSEIEELGELDLPGRPRLIDPTLFENDHGMFLFANDERDGPSVLRLWWSNSLFGSFAEHPSSPIRISPAGSRMGGSIHLKDNGVHFRFGQDLRRDYGDGLIIFRIDMLSPSEYRETEVGTVRLTELRGPHTLNFRDGRMLFDYYTNRFTPFAGIRRLRSRRAGSR
jgi:hypothetical protein